MNLKALIGNPLLLVLYQMLNIWGVADVFKKCCGYAFPKSMYILQKLLNADRNDFESYMVCQTYYKLFSIEDCLPKPVTQNWGIRLY